MISKKIMALYPPGPLYQRGEDRCQGNISGSSASAMRAANDLAYASATLKNSGHRVSVFDYQTERAPAGKIFEDVANFRPDAIFISTTTATLKQDAEIAAKIKQQWPHIVFIFKGALFFNPHPQLFKENPLQEVDYLIGGESEFALAPLVNTHFFEREKIRTVPGILFRDDHGIWQKTYFSSWESDLDRLPFPDRGSLNNRLYLRPDTGAPQATISTSKGCGAHCTYCLTPIISGRKVRMRSTDNILAELRECYHKFGIKDFFFKSDTFTMNAEWVRDLCAKINASDLQGKINWVANSRVNPLKLETLQDMKKAGCWLVAFGFESGSDETLKKIKKGATVNDNIRARELCRQAGLKCFGFFLIGLPWENWDHLNATKTHIFQLDCDFIEVHLALPYYGTELYEEARRSNVLKPESAGHDYFGHPTLGTQFLPIEEIKRFRNTLLRSYHIRPSYLLRRSKEALWSPPTLVAYSKYGARLLKNSFSHIEQYHLNTIFPSLALTVPSWSRSAKSACTRLAFKLKYK
jgi:radical SAM superfamily enzyme YgiQ (UPF0313 family)